MLVRRLRPRSRRTHVAVVVATAVAGLWLSMQTAAAATTTAAPPAHLPVAVAE